MHPAKTPTVPLDIQKNSETTKSCKGGNKLRTYNHFKKDFETEHYCMYVRSRKYRGGLVKFSSVPAHICPGTGRYEAFPVGERFCFCCNDIVEDELTYNVCIYVFYVYVKVRL
jgi:hypothetical protein